MPAWVVMGATAAALPPIHGASIDFMPAWATLAFATAPRVGTTGGLRNPAVTATPGRSR